MSHLQLAHDDSEAFRTDRYPPLLFPSRAMIFQGGFRMMSRLISGLLVILAFPTPASAGCSKNRIEITRSSGFGLSFGGGKSSINGSQSFSASIPVYANGQDGCWRQKSHLRFEVKADAAETRGKMDIYPVEAEFEDLENTSVHTYVIIEKETKLKVHVLSAVCVGNQVLSMESFSGESSELSKGKEAAGARVSSFLATGRAAAALRARQPGWGNRVPERFVRELELRNAVCASCEPNTQVGVPRVEIGMSVSAPGLKTLSSFSTDQANEMVCQPEFQRAMAQHEFTAYRKAKQAGTARIEYSKWRNRLRVEW